MANGSGDVDTIINPPPGQGELDAVSSVFTLRVVSLVASVLMLSTAAFARLERWTLLEAFYFVCTSARNP